MRVLRSLLLACLLPVPALAQQVLEVIALRHATVEQVLPALRPLLEPGGVLTGQSGQLIVRTSPGNLAELKRALEAIDRPARRLLISVRFDDDVSEASAGIAARGRVGSRGSDVELRAQGRTLAGAERVDQRLQVIEGARATIFTGESRPLRQRQLIRTPGGVVAQETIVVQEAATGFDVVPRVSGGSVFLEIAPQQQRFSDSPVPGAIESRGVATSARGPLGEWFELGGIASSATRDEGGIGSAGRAQAAASRRVWVKVEELR